MSSVIRLLAGEAAAALAAVVFAAERTRHCVLVVDKRRHASPFSVMLCAGSLFFEKPS